MQPDVPSPPSSAPSLQIRTAVRVCRSDSCVEDQEIKAVRVGQDSGDSIIKGQSRDFQHFFSKNSPYEQAKTVSPNFSISRR